MLYYMFLEVFVEASSRAGRTPEGRRKDAYFPIVYPALRSLGDRVGSAQCIHDWHGDGGLATWCRKLTSARCPGAPNGLAGTRVW